jgi:hypothetical protein
MLHMDMKHIWKNQIWRKTLKNVLERVAVKFQPPLQPDNTKAKANFLS